MTQWNSGESYLSTFIVSTLNGWYAGVAFSTFFSVKNSYLYKLLRMLDSLNDLIHNKYHPRLLQDWCDFKSIEQDFIKDLVSYGFSREDGESIFKDIKNSIK